MPLQPNEDPREELLEADRHVHFPMGGAPIIVTPYAWYRLARAAVLALVKIGRERF